MPIDNRKLIIRRLGEHAEEIESFTNGLTEGQLKERPAPGRWSLHEVAMHVVEVQDIFVERIARILVEDGPEIVPFEPDTARQEGLYLAEDLSRRMKEFYEQRKNLLGLAQTLTDEQWIREGNHPEVKHYTVEKCLEAMMRHEEHHLYQMFNLFFGTKN